MEHSFFVQNIFVQNTSSVPDTHLASVRKAHNHLQKSCYNEPRKRG